jgi:PAS domain S-box-containing protein
VNPSSALAVVVNDDPTQLNLLCGLVRKAGLEPRGFTGVEAALTDMAAGAGTADRSPGVLPALVVTDLYMPGIDGWRFCRLLRSPEYAAFNQIPILVVSATFSGAEASRIAAELGAEAFLHSPVDGRHFCDQVQAILRGERVRPPLRVLIAEDDARLCQRLKEVLTTHGYEPDMALTFQAAADAFAKTSYDMALLDYHLSDGSGDALLDKFCATRPDCVCVMMTGDTGPELPLEWMKRGAAACLQKPFQPAHLIELCARVRRERALLRVQDQLEVRTRELRQSEERFRSITQNAFDLVALLDVNGRYLYCNNTYTEILGYSPDELVGRSCFDLIHPDERERTVQLFQEGLARNQQRGNMLLRLRHRDGHSLLVDHHARLLSDGPGAPQILLNARDVTERNRAEKALRESERIARANEERLIMAQDIGRTGSWDLNLVTNSIWGSAEAHRLFGFPSVAKDFPIEDIESCIPERARVHQALVDLISLGKDYNLEYVINPADGSAPKVLHSIARLEKDAQGKPIKVMGVIRDLTERKRAEEERAKLETHFQHAQKMESVGRLAGGVAHDFNNMLQAILGNVDLALAEIPPGSPTRESLEEIQNCARRSAELTRQLLTFARKQTIAPKVLDLNQTVASSLKMLGRLIGENIHLAWLPATGLWAVKIDPTQVDQILANLCLNARDAIGGVGRVTIKTASSTLDEAHCAAHPGFRPGEYVWLAVSDNGRGMDQETLANIFEPFFTTKDVGEGTGLGLATVYGIVKQNNGFVCVDSEPGKGTTFKIYLPRHASQTSMGQTEEAAALAEGCGETLLLVEDEPAILAISRKVLERLGYKVLTASTPAEAIRLAEANASEIHLLVTDVVMPGMNGRDLANQLLSLRPNLKCLFMSGYTADIIAHHGALDGGVHFIQKPFSMGDLAAKVRIVVGSADGG